MTDCLGCSVILKLLCTPDCCVGGEGRWQYGRQEKRRGPELRKQTTAWQTQRHKEGGEDGGKNWGCKPMDACFVRHVMCDNSSFQPFSYLSPCHEIMLSRRHAQSEVISAGLEANKVNFAPQGKEENFIFS